MAVDHTVFDEHKDVLSLYWTTQDVLSFLAETSDDPHLLRIKALGEQQAHKESPPTALDPSVSDSFAGSKQYQKSAQQAAPQFDGLRTTTSGHRIQDVRELTSIPVIITSDVTKSPPVLVVYACR